jgi:hypothetical protein
MPSASSQLKFRYSVFIIGASINGCGTFRDLCLQGVDCLLRNVPHYVKPLEVVCPAKSWFAGQQDAVLG